MKASEVLVIHTDAEGEITKGNLEKAREAARDIDKPNSKTKAIVSVMMLREGWDVRNVSVVLGLRPFTAKAEILPEQVIGRGLRLMTDIGPDRTQTLEVLGTRNLLDVLRDKLEAEGVGVATSKSDPPQSITIYPMQERLALIVLQLKGDEEYNRWSRRVARKIREKDQPLAFIEIQKLAPARSRLVSPQLRLATVS